MRRLESFLYGSCSLHLRQLKQYTYSTDKVVAVGSDKGTISLIAAETGGAVTAFTHGEVCYSTRLSFMHNAHVRSAGRLLLGIQPLFPLHLRIILEFIDSMCAHSLLADC